MHSYHNMHDGNIIPCRSEGLSDPLSMIHVQVYWYKNHSGDVASPGISMLYVKPRLVPRGRG